MPTNPRLAKEAAQIARAISHPVRMQILQELRQEGGAYVMHLTAVLGRPQANISQHLMVLRQAGLVRAIREGMTVRYEISDPALLVVLDNLMAMATKRLSQTAVAGQQAHEQGRGRRRRGKCRCPRCAGK